MSRRRYSLLVIAALALLLVAQASLVSASDDDAVIKWDTMVGVPAGLTGAQSQVPLRGISGGGVPWTLNEGHGKLTESGELKIKVDGLVLAAGANAGSNPSATFRAFVSCVRGDGTFQNILHRRLPGDDWPRHCRGRRRTIKTSVSLPSPCIAPIVFVTSAGGSWFASTGSGVASCTATRRRLGVRWSSR